MLGWYKAHEANFIVFWFQCDKWGWEDDWGSKFTIEFQVSDSNEIASGSMVKRARVPYLLSDSDLELVRENNNSIIESLPGFKNEGQTYIEAEGEKILLFGKDKANIPYDKAHDIWFDYYSYEDINLWASFFINRIAIFEQIMSQGLTSASN